MPLRSTKRIEIADDPGEWVIVRMPTMVDIEDAKTVDFKRQVGRGMSLKDIEPDIDMMTILQKCIIEWSYADSLTPENIAQLDARKATQIYVDALRRDSDDEGKNSS